jgi:hypothetical protein
MFMRDLKGSFHRISYLSIMYYPCVLFYGAMTEQNEVKSLFLTYEENI